MPAQPLQTLAERLRREARAQKRRVRQRLAALRGGPVATPSRGPIQKNGRKCLRWHFWQAATARHQNLSAQINALHANLRTDHAKP